ncbi:uncharacterized protein LOC143175057 isoform X1 [Nomia melanderi]|uniref:uncharacterized protein LOC143175057 isoform X1 n=2 Tax=Nomia melanderi TaxID=2448451 RepID=UPI003FCE9ABD
MDNYTTQKQNYEKFKNTENQENETNNRTNVISHCTLQKNEKARSRSRSPNRAKDSKKWISSNAFINFVQDFRENHNGKSSTKIFQMAGERWKQMLPNEKQPYLEAAKNIKSYKQDQQKKKHTKNRDPTTAEPKKDKEGRQVKNTKKSQRNNKEKKQRRKKQYSTESDSDTVISATSAVSLTSEDLTDPSS